MKQQGPAEFAGHASTVATVDVQIDGFQTESDHWALANHVIDQSREAWRDAGPFETRTAIFAFADSHGPPPAAVSHKPLEHGKSTEPPGNNLLRERLQRLGSRAK